MPGMIWPVVAYAPKAATKPSIAAQPLNFSASGDMVFVKYKLNIKKIFLCRESFPAAIQLIELILFISKSYLIIEIICAACSLCECSLLLAKWLFSFEELDLPLEARFSSDWCIAFFLAFCLSNRIFNSVEFEKLGLEDKNNLALWSEFFLQRSFLIKGR